MILGESIYRGLSVGYSNFTSLIIQNKIVVIYYIFLVKYFFLCFQMWSTNKYLLPKIQ
jgi:hypothetical protein